MAVTIGRGHGCTLYNGRRQQISIRGLFNDLAARRILEALLLLASTDDLHDKAEVAGFVHELQAVVSASAKRSFTMASFGCHRG